MSRKVKKEGDAMADLLVALALLTFAGVEAAYRAKEKDNKE